MNRIAVVGIGGSGKSYAGRRIAEITRLPLIHMDNLFWKGKWEEIPEIEYVANHEEIIKADQWVIEGYIDEAMSDRFRRAEMIVYLDYSGIRCFFRAMKRWWQHRKIARQELHAEAVEEFDPNYLFKVVLFRQDRPGIEKALKKAGNPEVIRLYTPSEFEKFLLTLPTS